MFGGLQKQRIVKGMTVILSLTLLQGCLNSKTNSIVADNPEQGPLATFDANVYALNKVVCDPFEPGAPGPNDGLIAQLYYRGSGQNEWFDVLAYINNGIKSKQTFFFSNLDVPTRKFDMGFPKQTGGMVQNDSGQDLVEFFALRFTSVLKLAPQDEEGTYELALLSDDGATIKIRQPDGNYKIVVDNDGTHPTRMGCGERIEMTRESEVLVQMDYYQGPRYHIAMIPMWRKVSSSTPKDPRCGQSGNDLFFDWHNNSKPRAAYNEILSRGWKPIHADNWNLPAFAIFNPCTEGTVPTISNFRILENIEGMVTLAWDTNIPTTSQVLFKNVATGEEALTTADNRLRVNHQVSIYGQLEAGATYDFSAVSISADYGKSVSNPIRHTVR